MNLMDYPILIFALGLVVLWFSARLGAALRKHWPRDKEQDIEDFNIILGATLTLLGLIIGFTFSMATTRYDERKTYEEAEANAIGTEYVRADLFSESDAAQVRTLLASYLEQRILFYQARRGHSLNEINARTARLETDLWSAVKRPAAAQPNAVTGLVVSGMNDVLNSQGYTQAAWWNRIPFAAWILMFSIAIFSNMSLGYRLHRPGVRDALFLILPLVLSISFFLIADIDSPRGGLIRVDPQNLRTLSQSLHP